MYHTSPNVINEGSINKNGVAGDCLFFSDDVYMMVASKTCYVYEADFECVNVSQLYDDDIISDIANYFNCDFDLAESLLDGSENEWNQEFKCDGDDSWWLQGKRGQCAAKMGFDGCIDEDEQGKVYIVPMLNRENKLTLIETRNQKLETRNQKPRGREMKYTDRNLMNKIKAVMSAKIGDKIDFRKHCFLENQYGGTPCFSYDFAETAVRTAYQVLENILKEDPEQFENYAGWEYNTDMEIEKLRTVTLKNFIENLIEDMINHQV